MVLKEYPNIYHNYNNKISKTWFMYSQNKQRII